MSTGPSLPYAGLNLRRNPFGTLDGPALQEVVVVDMEEEVDAVLATLSDPSAPPLLVQLVGPPGSGKSTHLGALAVRLPRTPMLAWSRRTGWPAVPPGRSILLDDAHVMSGRVRRPILRRRAVVAASHHDLAPVFQRRGFHVRTVDVPSLVTGERLRAIVHRRMEAARRGPGPVPSVSDEELHSLLEKHGPDLRTIFHSLYDQIQEMQ